MDLSFNKNEDHNKLLLSDLRKRFAKVKLGGGEKRIEKHHAKGKMTARERIDYLLDDKKKAIEIGAFAGDGMYQEHGGCPSGGCSRGGYYTRGRGCCCKRGRQGTEGGSPPRHHTGVAFSTHCGCSTRSRRPGRAATAAFEQKR